MPPLEKNPRLQACPAYLHDARRAGPLEPGSEVRARQRQSLSPQEPLRLAQGTSSGCCEAGLPPLVRSLAHVGAQLEQQRGRAPHPGRRGAGSPTGGGPVRSSRPGWKVSPNRR